MAISTSLKLWCNAKIIPSRNLKIEYLDNYLNANTNASYNKTFSNIMFFKEIQSLEFDKVIEADQLNLQDKYDYSWDYATITIYDSANQVNVFKGYYFITKKTWTSTASIKLHFVLDTINTYELSKTIPTTSVTNKYAITNRSKVLREHKDRFINTFPHYEINEYKVQGFLPDSFVVVDNVIRVNFNVTKSINPHLIADFVEKFILNCKIMTSGGVTIYANVPIESSGFDKLAEDDSTITYLAYFPILTIYQGYYWSSSVINYLDVVIKENVANLSRIIDLQSEGVLPILYKEELGTLTQPVDTSWYLYYKTEHELSQESSNAVECLLIPEQELKLKIDANIKIKTAGDFAGFQNVANLYYVFNDSKNSLWPSRVFGAPSTNFNPSTQTIDMAQPVSIKADDEIFETKWRYVGWDVQVTGLRFFEQEVIRICVNPDDSSKIDIYQLLYKYQYRPDHTLFSSSVAVTKSKIAVTDIEYQNVQSDGTKIWGYVTPNRQITPTELLDAIPSFSLTFSSVTNATIYDLSNYDRTLSTLIKIIKIPYCPTDYTYDIENEQFTISSIFSYINGSLKLEDINAKFEASIETNIENPVLDAMFMQHTIATGQSRDKSLESKMFHSDYYQIKFVYDSFSYTIPLEKLDVANTNFTDFFRFKFIMTSTMNSKFAFMFEDIVYKYATEDYPNVLCVARNNEEVIYNSTYLNYLRTAYNYDLKAKERTEMASNIGTALTIVGSVASVGLAVASQNPALIVSSVIGATASITSAVINNVNTIAQQEANQESKLNQLQAQSVSVAGSDDVDIMSAYSSNRAKLCLYKVSERMYNALNDLFYYTGYATNEMKIPNMHTRYYFDFVAMNPEVVNICNLSDEIIEDIKTRWANGVTIMHGEDNQWNMAQDKENWEVNLL